MSLTLEFLAAFGGVICIAALFSGLFSGLGKKVDVEFFERVKLRVAVAYCNMEYFTGCNATIIFARPGQDVLGHCFGNGTLYTASTAGFRFPNGLRRWFP